MNFRILVLVVALAPIAVTAQGGMGGGMGGRPRGGPPGGMAGGRTSTAPKFPTAKELEPFNAALALLDERKKLKLTDTQIEQLTLLKARLYERNADLLARYDSVRRDFKPPKLPQDMSGPPGGMGGGMGGPPGGGPPGGGPPGGGAPGGGAMPSEKEMALMSEQMRVMTEIGDALLQRRPADVADGLALVDDGQRERATKILDEQSKDLRKTLPKMPTRDGGGRERTDPRGRVRP
ncbi:MAG: hypothetical protein IPP90_07125 [Gemmatimonadaceae bacterium]|nr:hypothetical protein [Gemmatimonadaceae bacterium]